jgi:hypothetical protein
MKELRIKRLINLENYENVEFEATFERHDIIQEPYEGIHGFIIRAFREFALILERAGFVDKKISWRKEA